MNRAIGGSGGAPGASATSVWVSRSSKMRWAAAMPCWTLAFTRLSFFSGPYISSSAARKAVKSPSVIRPRAISRLPYQSAEAIAAPPRNSITGGITDTVAVTMRLIR